MGSRLREALNARGRTAADLIAGTGLSKGTVYNLLGDKTRPDKVWADTEARICEYLRIDRDWLRDGRGGMERSETAGETDWLNVRGFAQAIGLGDGPDAQEYAETHKLKFRADSLARKRLNPSQLAVMYGRGDSMLPRIRSGDAILFDESDTRPADETLFVVLVHGVAGESYSAKRCRHFGSDVYFDALNPEGDHNWRKPRKMDDPKHPVKIIGRVRWIGSWED